MIQSRADLLDYKEIQDELKACAYYIFKNKDVADLGKPDFLTIESTIMPDFKEFVLDHQDLVYEALTKDLSPDDKLCMVYGLLEFLGSDIYGSYASLLQDLLLSCYLGNLLFVNAMAENFENAEISFLHSCVVVIFPAVFPLILDKVTKQTDSSLIEDEAYEIKMHSLNNIDIFKGIGSAKELLAIFFSKHGNIEISNAEEYLVWLHECSYFLYVLLKQDCTNFSVLDLEGIITFIKSKSTNLDPQELFANIAKFQPAINIISAMDNNISSEIYNAIRPALFQSVLDMFLSFPEELSQDQIESLRWIFTIVGECAFSKNKLPESQRIDIYTAILSIGSLDMDFITFHTNSFSPTALVEIAKKIRNEVFFSSGFFSCSGFLSIIVRHGKFPNVEDLEMFFTNTRDDFRFIFTGAMLDIAQYLYSDPGKNLSMIKKCDLSSVSFNMDYVRTHTDDFFILMNMAKEYERRFIGGIELLKNLYIVHLDVIDQNKSWGVYNIRALLKVVASSMNLIGIKTKDLHFINIQRACGILISTMTVSSYPLTREDEITFWEGLVKSLPKMHNIIESWSESQRSEIDSMCLDIVNGMRFSNDNVYAILQARLCIIIGALISKKAGSIIYDRISSILSAVNEQSKGSYEDLSCQTGLVKIWLIDYTKQNDPSFNSDVISKFIILPQNKMLPKHRLIYLCELVAIFCGLTSLLDYFYRKEELYRKIEVIFDFIIKERNELYTVISNLESLTLDESEELLLSHLQAFIDKDFLILAHNKLPNPCFSLPDDSLRSSYNVIPIEKVSFIGSDIVLYCDDSKYSFPASSMSMMSPLKAQVRFYKKKNSYYFFAGDDKSDLISLKPEGTDNNDQALPDDELFALFASGDAKPDKKSASQNKANSPSKNKKKNKSKSKKEAKPINPKAAQEAVVDDAEVINPKASEEPSIEEAMTPDLYVKEEKTVIELFNSLWQSSDSDNAHGFKKIVQDKLGFIVDFSLEPDAVIFSLGNCKLYIKDREVFASIEYLCQELKKLPEMFLAEKGASSFAEILYDSKGRVSKVKISDALMENFGDLESEVLEGDLALAVDIVSLSFLETIKNKFKVAPALKGSALCFKIKLSDSDLFYEISKDLKNIPPSNLWLELLKMHIGFLKKIYGGNVALFKLELSDKNVVVGIDRSRYLPISNNSLKRVDVSDNIAKSLTAFFAPMDKKLSKLFNILDVKMVEFILQLMHISDSGLLIYGHPVVECCYGEYLRSLGGERQPVKQLIVGLGRRYEPNAIRGMLSSSTFSPTVNDVNDSYIYCTYKNSNITICLDREQMKRSIFYGDRFCGLILKGVMGYSELQDNPKDLNEVMDLRSAEDVKLLSGNSYTLKVALDWCKIMGSLGGGIRKILERFNFLDVITSPELEHVTWQEKSGSKEFLPEAKNYLQTSFHLMSDDSEEVLAEVAKMLNA